MICALEALPELVLLALLQRRKDFRSKVGCLVFRQFSDNMRTIGASAISCSSLGAFGLNEGTESMG